MGPFDPLGPLRSASHIDLLRGRLEDAVLADRVEHREGLNANALIRSPDCGDDFADSRPLARALDAKTPGALLDTTDAAAAP